MRSGITLNDTFSDTIPDNDLTPMEQIEVHVRAIVYGMASAATLGLISALSSFAGVNILASLGDVSPCPIPDAIESCFTKSSIFKISVPVGLATGLLVSTCSFFPAAQYALEKGLKEGPEAIDLNPLHNLGF